MKRRDLERKLRIAGCYLKREGSSHSLWINPKNGTVEAVGKSGTILHYDGTLWTSMDSGISNNLYHIWNNPTSDGFAVGTASILCYKSVENESNSHRLLILDS